jgi:hypothetical protein
MRITVLRTYAVALILLVLPTSAMADRWTAAQANAWSQDRPWLVGANYIPANASNALEMWQKDTFDPSRIDLELGWAEAIGMNTVRVFLHDLLWSQDTGGFLKRISAFLDIAERHQLRTILVLFDSCWDPYPKLGQQLPPRPGVHNSRWVQSPGRDALEHEEQYPRLRAYVEGVIAAFGKDPRVLAWDLWNEPDNTNSGSYEGVESPDKLDRVRKLLPQVFLWARNANPMQPLTSAVWHDGTGSHGANEIERLQLSNSDIVSFHNYGPAAAFEQQVDHLESYGRPVLCTEYMARPLGSTFEAILPITREHRVGAINWGLVNGKTQTNFSWDSWQQPSVGSQPSVWFHDIFRSDGTPYRAAETELIRKLTQTQIVSPSATRDRAASPRP